MSGYFESFFDGIPQGEQRWLVGLRHTTMVWLDCVDEGPEGSNARREVERKLDHLRAQVTTGKPQHFVYFLASRPRIRISSRRPPRYSRWRKMLIIWIEVGTERKLRRVELPLPLARLLPPDAPLRCPFRWTDKFLTFELPSGVGMRVRKVSVPIHDLLEDYVWNLEEHSHVHYVGMTKNPRKRVFDNTRLGIKGKHDGYARVRNLAHAHGRDLFVFFLVMDVHVVTRLDQFGIVAIGGGPISSKLDCRDEARVLEKALIAYFAPAATGSFAHESGELRELCRCHNIAGITLSLEMKTCSDYFHYMSEEVPAHARIGGHVRIDSGVVEVTRRPDVSEIELQAGIFD